VPLGTSLAAVFGAVWGTTTFPAITRRSRAIVDDPAVLEAALQRTVQPVLDAVRDTLATNLHLVVRPPPVTDYPSFPLHQTPLLFTPVRVVMVFSFGQRMVVAYKIPSYTRDSVMKRMCGTVAAMSPTDSPNLAA
jgi:hypothetical protein